MAGIPIKVGPYKEPVAILGGVFTVLKILSDKEVRNGLFNVKDIIFGSEKSEKGNLTKIDKNLFFNLEKDYIKNSKDNVSIDAVREQLVKAAIEYVDFVKTNYNKFNTDKQK